MITKNIIICFLIFILFVFFILLCNNNENFINVNDFKYYDESNNVIDHNFHEIDEQQMAIDYISPNDIILELGARYGTVSVIMAKIVQNNGKLVAVEIDKNVIDTLKKNRENNNVNFEICDSIISNRNVNINYDGYSTYISQNDNSTINNPSIISYNEFKKKYPYNFNVLVADCEGCLEYFLEMMGDDIKNYNKILFEEDQPHICNYENIKNKLTNYGFKQKNVRFNIVNRYYFVRE